MTRGRSAVLALASVLALGGAACTTAEEAPETRAPATTPEGPATEAPEPTTAPEAPETVAYKLAVIHTGDPNPDPSVEAEFQRIIDCIMASGIEGAETEEKVGDTLVASWQQSAQQETLLEWSQVFC